MLFDDADTALLKVWVITQVEKVSDADPDVLAEYVLALLKSPYDSTDAAKANCVDNLRDFLGDASEKFVDELFNAINNKSYDPLRPSRTPAPSIHPSRTSLTEPLKDMNIRKRGYHDWDGEGIQLNGIGYQAEERPMKQPRRGRRGDHQVGQMGSQQHLRNGGRYQQNSFPKAPTPPPGMPAFDPSNPFASFLQLQQAMGMFSGFPLDGSAARQRCKDFDTKGFCTQGANCPYEHGNDPFIVPNNEYDPTRASLLHIEPNHTGVVKSSPGGRGRGKRGRGRDSNYRGGGQRAAFSRVGPNNDRSITSIVVEQIPKEHCNERSVRGFFSNFGAITEVTMQPRYVAIVKFDGYEAARAAYDSPKAVFDNRFVKVYWHAPDASQSAESRSPNKQRIDADVTMEDEEMHIDMEEVAKKQEEAQRRHEEQKRLREGAEVKRRELDGRMKAIEAERQKLADALAKKAADTTEPPEDTITVDNPDESEQTKGLRAQLAKLEAEAKSLGIDPNATTDSFGTFPASPYYQGRGGFRGRYRGRAGYNASMRGGWPNQGAVKRLDNRPKTVALAFTEGTYEDHEESLKQWLIFSDFQSATLTKHPEPDHLLVTFSERYLGESFMAVAASPSFVLAGKVGLPSWYKAEQAGHSVQSSEVMEDSTPSRRDLDSYDDDDDHWT